MGRFRKTKSNDLNLIISKKIDDGFSYKQIFDYLVNKNLYSSTFDSFCRYARSIKNRHGVIREEISKLTDFDKRLIKFFDGKKALKINDITEKFHCSRTTLKESIRKCRFNGYEIQIDDNIVILSNTNVREPEKVSQLANNTEIVFGVVSDPHFGSKSCQITALNEFAEIMKHKGVHHIFVPGDLVSGFEVYPGQIHDVYAIDAKGQEESTLVNLPRGFNWYVLGGNHDYSYIKRGGGYNIISAIASKRPDIHYIGFDQATVPILKNVDLMCVHPSGGVPYSISYRLQKNIEQITIGELQNVVRGVKDKPSIRFVLLGHLHIQMQALFGPIWGAQCGTFEGQTNYLKRKGLVPSIGGYIVKASLGKNGLLKSFEAKFYIFDEIEDDWKNYKHTSPEKKITKPIMEL
jgi:predicted phosphodiesterase